MKNNSKHQIMAYLKDHLRKMDGGKPFISQLNALSKTMNQPYLLKGISKGSIFETESSLFVVGVKLPSIKYFGKYVVGLTTDSPLYRLFKDKKDGDEITYGKDLEHICII